MEKECACATVDIEKVVVRKKGAKHNILWSLYGKKYYVIAIGQRRANRLKLQ